MKKIILVVALALAASLPIFAQSPALEIQSGNLTANLDLSLANGVWTLAAGNYQLGNGLGVLKVSDLTIDPDPTIHYGFGVTNNSNSTMTYTFSFPSLPVTINLPPGLYNVSSSFSGSLTDGGTDGVTFAPVSTAIQRAFVDSTDAGVDLVNSTLTASSGATSQGFGNFAASGTLNLPSGANVMSLTTSFTLSPNDSASFSGRFDIVAAPEPSSVSLLAIGAGAFALLILRRRLQA